MKINFLILGVSALVPLVIGFIWYNPKVFGTAWMKSANLNEDKLKGANMPLMFGFAILFGFFIAMILQFLVIHQWGIFSTLDPNLITPGSELETLFNDLMAKFGNNFRTFKHGVLHGTMSGIFFALPIIATNAMFERKGFKYIAINSGYWIVTLAIMGGIISQYA